MNQPDEAMHRRFVGSWMALGLMALMALWGVISSDRPASPTTASEPPSSAMPTAAAAATAAAPPPIPTVDLEAARQDPVRLVTAYVVASADVVRESNPMRVVDLVEADSPVWRDLVRAADDRRRTPHAQIPVLDRMVVESVSVSDALAVVTTREEWTLMTIIDDRSMVSRSTARYAYRLRRSADGWRMVEALTIEAVRRPLNE
ncbi:hypothetical protein [Roseiflexus castenholzii]|uniref:hypothetical protein n=1 Tax=Roseiflexus castenholzii TaxID=120962 RepID=UPI003C7B8F97